MSSRFFRALIVGLIIGALARVSEAQAPSAPPSAPKATEAVGITPPAGYVIGADDVLALRFWGDTQLSVDVVVRPDGKISLPLVNDVQAAGLTPEDLSSVLEKLIARYVTEPDATVIVREIRSRKVFVLGQGIAKPGIIPLNSDMTVLQVLAASGGLLEYADKEGIVILRSEHGRERRLKFNFSDVVKGKKVEQNILLQPGDTVLVN